VWSRSLFDHAAAAITSNGMGPATCVAGRKGFGGASRWRSLLHQPGEWLARIDHPQARGLSAQREELLAVDMTVMRELQLAKSCWPVRFSRSRLSAGEGVARDAEAMPAGPLINLAVWQPLR
jgi:hypothetical protein